MTTTDQQVTVAGLLTVAEMASYLRVSKMTVYRMLHGGVLPFVVVGRRSFRIRRADAIEYLRQARVANGAGVDGLEDGLPSLGDDDEIGHYSAGQGRCADEH